MNAAELFQLGIDGRLQTDGKTIDPGPPIGRDLFRIDRTGIELDGNFRPVGQAITFAQTIHTSDDQLRVDDGRRSSPEIDRIEYSIGQVLCAQLHFFIHACHIRLGKSDLTGVGGKIAIAALRYTEGNVDINAGHTVSFALLCHA